MLSPIKIQIVEKEIPPIQVKIYDKDVYRQFVASSMVGQFIIGSSRLRSVTGTYNLTNEVEEQENSSGLGIATLATSEGDEDYLNVEPLKIRLAERDKDMCLTYQKHYARVKVYSSDRKSFTVVTKPLADVLPTDEIIEYILAPEYIQPVVIKIPEMT